MFFCTRYRHLPDRLSAFAGCFSFVALGFFAYLSHESLSEVPPTKLYTNILLLAKRGLRTEARLFLKKPEARSLTEGISQNLLWDRGEKSSIGGQRGRPGHFAIQSMTRQGPPGDRRRSGDRGGDRTPQKEGRGGESPSLGPRRLPQRLSRRSPGRNPGRPRAHPNAHPTAGRRPSLLRFR
jgi:hypothetical protein